MPNLHSKKDDCLFGHQDVWASGHPKATVVVFSGTGELDLEATTDAHGKSLKVIPIAAPEIVGEDFETKDFSAGYINFYVCNEAVIATEFGDDKADGIAKEKLKEAFPDREIVMLNIDGIAAGGGGIHCATPQEQKV